MSRTNREIVQGMEEDQNEAWALSKSKSILRTGLLNGTILPSMKPKEIFDMHPEEHSKWEYTNWTNNLRNLRHAIEKDNKRMHDDMLSYGHDLAIVNALRAANPNRKPRWRGSEAAKRLKEDVDKGKHLEMKPSTLHQTRPEYLVFDLDVFRKHIYQEVDSRPKRAYRFEKKKKAWKYPELHKERPDL